MSLDFSSVARIKHQMHNKTHALKGATKSSISNRTIKSSNEPKILFNGQGIGAKNSNKMNTSLINTTIFEAVREPLSHKG